MSKTSGARLGLVANMNTVGWIAVLIVPAILYTLFWYGTGVGEGQCDALRILQLKELLTSEERLMMNEYFECGDTE